MAELKLTTEQKQVVEARDASLLVAAAAGSGKTAVLVRRMIEKVLDEEHPSDIDRMLIVTFTNAAASEMRERIGKALEEALLERPNHLHLQRQLLLLHNAQITTIHSFCLSVLRENFHLVSVDPGFRIAEEAELALLRSDVLAGLLEERYAGEDPAFFSLAECYGNLKNDKILEGYVDRLYRYAISQPWQEDWLQEIRNGFSVKEEDFFSQPLLQFVLWDIRQSLQDAMALQKKMVCLAQSPGGPSLYLDCFADDGIQLEKLSIAVERGYRELANSLAECDFMRLPGKKQEADEEKKEQAKELRAQMKAVIGRLQKDYFFETPEKLYEEVLETKQPIGALIDLTLDFMRSFTKVKREKNILDFSDLEQYALAILVEKRDGKAYPTPTARQLATRYDEIMIDEYQDSNLVQEYILSSISGEWGKTPNLFMVGDVKQSIYRFRMARPQLFVEKYERFTYEENSTHRKIDLNKNFRSRASVLASVNLLFEGLMHRHTTEVEYDEKAQLNYGELYDSDTELNKTELLLVPAETAGEEASDEEAGEKNAIQTEAMAVALRIRELVEQGIEVTAKEGKRPVRYEDIVILLRTMAGWSECFLETLTEQGIPAYADTSAGYFRAMEIQKTLSFLTILDNPKQDIPFAAVLHSPIAGLTANELALIQIQFGRVSDEKKIKRTLYEAAEQAYRFLKEVHEKADGTLSGEQQALLRKLGTFFDLYYGLRAQAEYVSIQELLRQFYTKSGYYDTVSVMPGGERRRGNLEMLMIQAKQYETTSYRGLYDFLRYMERLVRYEVDFGEAKTEATGNMVRIMSIHKSKGLEFPVVFVSGMEKGFHMQDMRNRLIFHPELGIGAEFVDRRLRVKGPTIYKKALAKKLVQEMISEELRVLYVAMTRAKEKLIMTGAVKKPEARKKAWEERAGLREEQGLLALHVFGASNYFDFVCPMVLGNPAAQPYYTFREISPEQLILGRLSDAKKSGELLSKLKTWETKQARTTGLSGELLDLLKAGETYSYPFSKEAELPYKVTVSELKRLSMEPEEEEPRVLFDDIKTEPQDHAVTEREPSYPRFLKQEEELTGAGRGTMYHRVMELLPMEEEYTRERLQEVLASMNAEAVSADKLLRFLNSPLAKRMQTAARQGLLYREQPFVLKIAAKELYPETDLTEPVLVQGIIDAFFVEGQELVLLDYKTDIVKGSAKEELTKKYRSQLMYYRRALSQLYGLSVKEARIYSFYADCDFEV